MSRSFDFIILGSGIAGLSLALKLAKHGKVAVVTKKNRRESNTNYAQGGVACVTSEEDSFELHIQDTLRAGAGLCNETVVRDVVADGPQRIQELIDLGVRFSERDNVTAKEKGALDLGKEGGHSKRRVLHAADMTGKEIERALIKAIELDERVEVFENYFAIDLLVSDKLGLSGEKRCVGIYVFDPKSRVVKTFLSSVTILATGGCGKTYLYTSNPDIATGDGVAMAFRAGIPIVNMEFIQFHPSCLHHPLTKSFLISEALRGEGAKLVNKLGLEFAFDYDERGSLASRDIVARAIDAEMKKSGADCVYLDIRHRGKDFIETRFPNIYSYCLRNGIDASSEPIPVVPAAHYQCGGIQVDVNGATTLPGVFAIGEVAHSGLHGANRLASNSLLEALVMAHRCHDLAVEQAKNKDDELQVTDWEEGDADDPDERVVVSHNWREIRQLMWDYVGIVRTNKRLERAKTRLGILNQEIQAYYWDFKVAVDLLELRNLVHTCSIIVESALQRKESRGLHYTLDYPQTSAKAKDTIIHDIDWL
ncbi:MAG: L-aspartate oxidase [Verrucomicrobiota bacterium]